MSCVTYPHHLTIVVWYHRILTLGVLGSYFMFLVCSLVWVCYFVWAVVTFGSRVVCVVSYTSCGGSYLMLFVGVRCFVYFILGFVGPWRPYVFFVLLLSLVLFGILFMLLLALLFIHFVVANVFNVLAL